MPRFSLAVTDVWTHGAVGATTALLLAVASLLSVAAVLSRSHAKRERTFIVGAASCQVVALATGWIEIAGLRRRFVESILSGAGPDLASLQRAEATQYVLAAASLFVLPALAIAVARAASRGARVRAEVVLRTAFVVCVFGAALATALLLTLDARARFLLGPADCLSEACKYERWTGVGALPHAGLLLGLVVAPGGLALVGLSFASGETPLPRLIRPLSVALLVLGASAFAATRGAARDSSHAVPPWDAPDWDHEAVDASLLPQIADLPPEGMKGPIVVVTKDHAVFGNGSGISDAGAFVRAAIEAWPMTHPERPSTATVYLAAPSALRLRDLAGVVQQIRSNGASELRAVVAVPPRVHRSETLGDLARVRRVSSVPIGELPTNEDESWGRWLAASRPAR